MHDNNMHTETSFMILCFIYKATFRIYLCALGKRVNRYLEGMIT